MTLATTNTIYGKRDPALVDMWGTSYQNMKYQSSLRRRVITGGSEKAVRVSRRILAPKLTSRACALRVCSPPAAIAVTQAISQTLICKALRIDSPPHAQMNKQRHKTWSFCLKYYILSKSNKIQRQVGDIFHL